MRKTLVGSVLIGCLFFPGEKSTFFQRDRLPGGLPGGLKGYPVVSIPARSSIGTREDPLARFRYEAGMLADPSTGAIPSDVRQKELRFEKTIPTRLSHYRAAGRRVSERNYEPAGPFNVGGRTRAAALDILDENTILAGGVSGGMWKTTNGGIAWTRTSDPEYRNSITCLAQDTRPGKEHIWYYGTGELTGNSASSVVAPYRGAGLYKSTDNGDSWLPLSSTDESPPDQFNSQFQYIWSVETNPTNEDADEVLIAAYGGILRSTDGGETWSAVLGEALFGLPDDADLNTSRAPFYTDLAKTSDGFFYSALSATTSSGVRAESAGFYFSDDGITWSEITPPGFPASHNRTVIGLSEANENVVYFFSQLSNGGHALWRYRFLGIADGLPSGTWTNLSHNIPPNFDTQSSYNMVVEPHPGNPDIVFLGGINLYRSTDGFSTNDRIKWIGGYHPDNSGAIYPNHYPDQHLILFYPSDPDKMITACDGGLRLTHNNRADSVSWTSLNNGYLTSQFYTITQQWDAPTTLTLGGMQDNGSYLRSSPGANPYWNRLLGGDGGYAAITPNQDFFYVSFQNSTIYRFTLSDNYNLTSYARVDPVGGGEDGQEYLFINPYILDRANPNRMFLAGGNVIWRNHNLAQIPGGSQKKTSVNWGRIDDTEIRSAVYTALAKASTKDRLYAGYTGAFPGILRIDNASVEGAEIVRDMKSGLFPGDGHIACIEVDPEDADHLLVIFSNYNTPSVFESTDGGESFVDVSGNLEEYPDGRGNGPSVRWAEIIPTKSGRSYFVGASIGLYSTESLQAENTLWVKESPGEIGKAVVTMLNYRDKDGRLVIATHGSGTFQVYIDDFRELEPEAPDPGISLRQNYPNPFQDKTTIDFYLPENGTAKIDIYALQGRHIKTLLWGPHYAGKNTAIWDGTNTTGFPVKNGVYLYTLTFKEKTIGKKMLYLR